MLLALSASTSFAATQLTTSPNNLVLQKQPSFFRFSFDEVSMPQNIQPMGLLGINYFADITPNIYAGVGGYGAVTGSQGGLFVLGIEGGLHHEFFPHWWGDAGVFAGGGGGRSSLVGGGLMLRPHAGIAYQWSWARLGIHYSYVKFPSGFIHSSQVGLDFDIPWDFYYVSASDINSGVFTLPDIKLPLDKFLFLRRNDFGLLVQAYKQKPGTKNNAGMVQDGTIGLVGAELDHYITDNGFWYVKAAGAFSGIPNGYMDVLGGLGYHWGLGSHGFALVPQFGIGAGGGGMVETGGGVLIQPQLGVEWPLSSHFATRFSGGYLWSPKGNLSAVTGTAQLLYHLDIATAANQPGGYLPEKFDIQGWRISIFNQKYFHPQRTFTTSTSAINMIALQFDQLFTPNFFISYQAAAAYSGLHAGGYATGMIGPGLQTSPFFSKHLQLFTEVLAGAGGGGSLALGGGALIEPVVGLNYAFTPGISLQTSVAELKALRNNLNTPLFNLGISFEFGMLERA